MRAARRAHPPLDLFSTLGVRALLGYDKKLCAEVTSAFVVELFTTIASCEATYARLLGPAIGFAPGMLIPIKKAATSAKRSAIAFKQHTAQ